MSKKIAQKNTELLLVQQRTELEKLRSTLPIETIRVAEDKLLLQCIDIVEGLLDFAALGFDEAGALDPGQLPLEWVDLTPDEKARKIRLARYGCLPSSHVPHGAKVAHATLIGIMKARAAEKGGTKVFNLEVSQFPAPAPLTQTKETLDADYEVIDLE
jgi:hypothetical protein